jgi:hypothetical protein
MPWDLYKGQEKRGLAFVCGLPQAPLVGYLRIVRILMSAWGVFGGFVRLLSEICQPLTETISDIEDC